MRREATLGAMAGTLPGFAALVWLMATSAHDTSPGAGLALILAVITIAIGFFVGALTGILLGRVGRVLGRSVAGHSGFRIGSLVGAIVGGIIPVPMAVILMSIEPPNPDWEISTVDYSSGERLKITKNSAYDGQAAWSPSGDKIVFSTDRDGNREVYVMNADGSDPTNLSNNPADDWLPAWSPDGSQLAFISDRDGTPALYLMRANGLEQNRLTVEGIAVRVTAWSPHGDALAVVSESGGVADLYLVRVESGIATRLTEDVDARDCAWSPDGKSLAFTAPDNASDEDLDIYVIDIDSRVTNKLTSNSSDDWSPVWSPDGQQLAFVSNRGPVMAGYYNNRIIVWGSGGSKELTYYVGPGGPPSWSPDGYTLVYRADACPSPQDCRPMIGGINVDHTFPREFDEMPADSLEMDWPTWSPDGRTLLLAAPDW